MAEDDTIEEGVLEQLVQKLEPCIGRGDLDACVEEAARLAGEIGMSADDLLILSAQMGRGGDCELAYVLALGAVNGLDDSNNYVAEHYHCALLLSEFGNKYEAEVQYKKAIEADPSDAAPHSSYALLLSELGNKYEAEVQYKKAIEADPNYVTAHHNYASLLREQRKFYDAEKEVRLAIQIAQADPSKQYILPSAHATLGDILADEDYPEDAVKEYEKALSLLNGSHSEDAHFSSELHNNIGWACIQLKKLNKARGEFRSACALDSMNVKAIRNLRALGRTGNEPVASRIQICLGMMLLILLISSYYLFFNGKLSETSFIAQSTFFIALLIFVALHHQLVKVKIGNIEFEKSAEHRYMEPKRQSQEAISMMER